MSRRNEMANIDSIEEIEKIDQEGFLNFLKEFPEQCERTWDDWKNNPLPARYVQTKSILIIGMGGSGIAGALIKGMLPDCPIPIVMWQDYGIPGWVNKDTLVIAISYSGNTEETLDSFKKATEKTDKLVSISQGGELDILSRKYKTCHYKINYAGQPRASFGFLFTSVLSVFSKLKLIEVSEDDFKEAMVLIRALQKKIDNTVPAANNNAKLLAKKLYERIPIVFGSGYLAEMARRWSNEFGENAKSASYYQILPEMNHNTFNGIEFPKDLSRQIYVLVLQSKYDHPRNRIRQDVSMQVLQKYRIGHESVMLEPSPTALTEILQFTLYGAYVSYYLGILYGTDPSQIKVVNFLKDKLAEHPLV